MKNRVRKIQQNVHSSLWSHCLLKSNRWFSNERTSCSRTLREPVVVTRTSNDCTSLCWQCWNTVYARTIQPFVKNLFYFLGTTRLLYSSSEKETWTCCEFITVQQESWNVAFYLVKTELQSCTSGMLTLLSRQSCIYTQSTWNVPFSSY